MNQSLYTTAIEFNFNDWNEQNGNSNVFKCLFKFNLQTDVQKEKSMNSRKGQSDSIVLVDLNELLSI